MEKKDALKEKAIDIVDAFVHKDYETVIQEGSLNMRTTVTPEYLISAVEQWPDVYGAYVEIDRCDITLRDTLYIANVSVNFEHYKQMFMLAFDNNEKLIGIVFK